MQSARENEHIVAKFEDKEDFFEALDSVINKHDIKSAVILSGIGMLRDIEIGYYNGKEYISKKFIDPMELLSMHGSIAYSEENRIHVHVGLANSEHKVFGGHLMGAKVCVLNEIVLLKLEEMTLARKLDPKSGLSELEISDEKGA
ncbi:MAG: DNA-binding protein [Thermoplasmata archaeon]|nr:MAG: DNA-binding protein [Thermoplasmata archaeon]